MMAEIGIGYGCEEMNCVVLRMNQYLEEHQHNKNQWCALYMSWKTVKSVCACVQVHDEHEKLFNKIETTSKTVCVIIYNDSHAVGL